MTGTPSVEATVGDVGDFFAYADPNSPEAALPGVNLDERVAAMEANGVTWLEQGAAHDGFGAAERKAPQSTRRSPMHSVAAMT